jgi:hypothetical protein
MSVAPWWPGLANRLWCMTKLFVLLGVVSYLWIPRHWTRKSVIPSWDVKSASTLALEQSAWQPPPQISRWAMSLGWGHHGGIMHGGGSGKIGGRGVGGENFYNSRIHSLFDHGGCCCPTVTMGTHPRCRSIQQSTNILCNRSTSLKLQKIYSYNE